MSAAPGRPGPPAAAAGPPPRTPPSMFGNRPIGGLGVPTQKAKTSKARCGACPAIFARIAAR